MNQKQSIIFWSTTLIYNICLTKYKAEGRKQAVEFWWRLYIFYTGDISWSMLSLMMQSPAYVNIYYAGCVNGAQEKWEILVFKLQLREGSLQHLFKTAWEVTAYLLFRWFKKYKCNKNIKEKKMSEVLFWKRWVSVERKKISFTCRHSQSTQQKYSGREHSHGTFSQNLLSSPPTVVT